MGDPGVYEYVAFNSLYRVPPEQAVELLMDIGYDFQFPL